MIVQLSICLLLLSVGANDAYAVQQFLSADETDEHAYTDTYKCGEFADDLVRNSTEPLYVCALDGHKKHVIVAANFMGTWVLIEPQNDEFLSHQVLVDEGFRSYRIGKSVEHIQEGILIEEGVLST